MHRQKPYSTFDFTALSRAVGIVTSVVLSGWVTTEGSLWIGHVEPEVQEEARRICDSGPQLNVGGRLCLYCDYDSLAHCQAKLSTSTSHLVLSVLNTLVDASATFSASTCHRLPHVVPRQLTTPLWRTHKTLRHWIFDAEFRISTEIYHQHSGTQQSSRLKSDKMPREIGDIKKVRISFVYISFLFTLAY